MRRRGATFLRAAVLGLAAACEHAQPFGAPDLGSNVPVTQGLPLRLTFSPLGDLAPAWLPDGSGIIYSYQPLERRDGDRCLGILPGAGGHLVRSICHASAFDAYSTNTLWEPAPGPGGLLAYVRENSAPFAPAPRSRELIVASLDAPDPGRVVRSFPYTAPDGTLHESAMYLHWVDDRTLVYLAEHVTYFTPPQVPDTVYTPVGIALLSVGPESSTVTVVPGTANATSVTADSAGAIYYTLAGDSRVLRIPPGGGAAAPLFDFEPLGPVSNVQVAGNTLVAVTCCGLYGEDLASATLKPIAAPGGLTLERLALSPAATLVVVQARDTAASDLWLLRLW